MMAEGTLTSEAPSSTAHAGAKALPPAAGTACDWKTAAAFAAVYFAVAAFNLSSHVLWRDELRIWQWALLSPTFAEMRANMQFEGAPWLWYGSIWLIARATTNVFAMQLFHGVIAAGTIFLFTWRAPFGRGVKLLFPLGYFTLFEYATITRNYALVLFFTLAAAAIISLPRRRPLLLAGVLFLLSQTNIWGAGVAGVMCAAALLEWTLLQPREARMPWLQAALLGGVVVGGGVLCYWSSLPGPGASFIHFWGDHETFDRRLGKTVGSIWRGYVPIPRFTRTYWNTNILDDYVELRCACAAVLFLTMVIVLLRKPAALAPLLLGSMGLMGFTLLRFVGAVRHDGLYFVLLIAAFWLSCTTTSVEIPWPRLARLNARLQPYGGTLLIALLSIQAAAGLGATIADHMLPFSAGKEVAEFVRRELPEHAILVGYDDYESVTMGFYAGRRVHSVQAKIDSVLFTQDDRVRRLGGASVLIEGVEQLLRHNPHDLIVFLSSRRDDELQEHLRKHPKSPVAWERLGRFTNSTIEDEGPTVYRALLNLPSSSSAETSPGSKQVETPRR